MKTQTKGFSIVEIIMVLGVIALLGGLGYVAWKSFLKPSETASTTTTASTSKTAEVITSQADLEAAEKKLESLSFEDEDIKQAEAQAEL